MKMDCLHFHFLPQSDTKTTASRIREVTEGLGPHSVIKPQYPAGPPHALNRDHLRGDSIKQIHEFIKPVTGRRQFSRLRHIYSMPTRAYDQISAYLCVTFRT